MLGSERDDGRDLVGRAWRDDRSRSAWRGGERFVVGEVVTDVVARHDVAGADDLLEHCDERGRVLGHAAQGTRRCDPSPGAGATSSA